MWHGWSYSGSANMTGIYRIPTKAVYKKTHTKNDPTWDEVYGQHDCKCMTCKKHFLEGDTYIVVTLWKKHSDGSSSPTHKYQHTDCTTLKENLPIRKKEKEQVVKRKWIPFYQKAWKSIYGITYTNGVCALTYRCLKSSSEKCGIMVIVSFVLIG